MDADVLQILNDAFNGTVGVDVAAHRLDVLMTERPDVKITTEKLDRRAAVLSAMVPYLTDRHLERIQLTREDRWACFQIHRTATALRAVTRLNPEWAYAVLVGRADVAGFGDEDLARTLCALPMEFVPRNADERRVYDAVLRVKKYGDPSQDLPKSRAKDLAMVIRVNGTAPFLVNCFKGCEEGEEAELVDGIPSNFLVSTIQNYMRYAFGDYPLLSEKVRRLIRYRVMYNNMREPHKGRAQAPTWARLATAEDPSVWAWENTWDMKRLEAAGAALQKVGDTLAERVDVGEEELRAVRGAISVTQWTSLIQNTRNAILTVVEVARDWDKTEGLEATNDCMVRLGLLDVGGFAVPMLKIQKKGVFRRINARTMGVDAFVRQEVGLDIAQTLGELVEMVPVVVDNLIAAYSSIDLNKAIKRRLDEHEAAVAKRAKKGE